ncbi:CvpA family protein [Fructobacillus sp. M1-13]|uniref:CvpA family protein n=1 Tax=Fructobacillus papyriferae TaxID=2713171 RepID=A0ABS5QSY9_9LACO|nr:CvpA family protein [Fructobacillus papyriferae]MBS9335429.1 CvpA family protein [Fructobacillus papyriferae]MCD2158900.1 CvpA family protein [Fructobacillus papyriferae]
MVLMWIGILFLVLMVHSGYKTGFTTSLARIVLWGLVLYVALVLSKPLSTVFAGFISGQFARPTVPTSWANSGTSFLASGLAFALILALGSFVGHFLLRSIHFVRRIPLLGKLDGLLGAALSLVLGLVLIFFCLQILSVIPNAWLQGQFAENQFLNHYLDQFPIISNQIYQWWL